MHSALSLKAIGYLVAVIDLELSKLPNFPDCCQEDLLSKLAKDILLKFQVGTELDSETLLKLGFEEFYHQRFLSN